MKDFFFSFFAPQILHYVADYLAIEAAETKTKADDVYVAEFKRKIPKLVRKMKRKLL